MGDSKERQQTQLPEVEGELGFAWANENNLKLVKHGIVSSIVHVLNAMDFHMFKFTLCELDFIKKNENTCLDLSVEKLTQKYHGKEKMQGKPNEPASDLLVASPCSVREGQVQALVEEERRELGLCPRDELELAPPGSQNPLPEAHSPG